MKITSRSFGFTKNEEEVTEYTLHNDLGSSVSIITLGGIITKINVPDKNKKIENVVLGFNSVKEYEELSAFYGAITGRVAGRISGAKFQIGENLYELAANDGPNNLHSGPVGLDKVVWSASEKVTEDNVILALNYMSPHLDQGFPGNLDLVVRYTFGNDNALSIDYIASTDAETLLNITNHTYFNLSGDFSTTILDHELTIAADTFVAVDALTMPSSIDSVESTPFDFRTAKKVGAQIEDPFQQLLNGKGYDHAFVLNPGATPQILLKDEKSGRQMEVKTTEACVVCYTGNYLKDTDYVYDHQPIQKRSALCLETQYYPDSQNVDFIPSKTLKPNERYHTKTTFIFS